MHIARDDIFDEQASRFALRFTCEDCGHFDSARDMCAHEWPTALHRIARYGAAGVAGVVGAVTVEEVVFCKEFELA